MMPQATATRMAMSSRAVEQCWQSPQLLRAHHSWKQDHKNRWWKMYGKHLPLLCKYATCILAQPGAASAAERNWSIYGLIKSDRATRLRPVVADKKVYCHEALALHARLQDAGYRPEAQDWDEVGDSDSDSDHSEGEAEKDEDISHMIV